MIITGRKKTADRKTSVVKTFPCHTSIASCDVVQIGQHIR